MPAIGPKAQPSEARPEDGFTRDARVKVRLAAIMDIGTPSRPRTLNAIRDVDKELGRRVAMPAAQDAEWRLVLETVAETFPGQDPHAVLLEMGCVYLGSQFESQAAPAAETEPPVERTRRRTGAAPSM